LVDVEYALRSLVERPDRPPEPVDELERRVVARRRRRTQTRLAAAVVVLLLAASVPVLAGWRDRGTVVETGPIGRPPGPGLVTDAPRPPRVQADIPPGWETLVADGERLVLATRPLDERDVALAVLARDDAVFEAFPADGVALVVGSDRFVAKYTMGEVGRTVENGVETVRGAITGGPGPANGLGEPKSLPGGVRVRRGDVPQSTAILASYAGPAAPADAVRQAEAIAASVRLRPLTAEQMRPPPPGSRPGFDGGQPDVPDERLRTVATSQARGVTVTFQVGDGCAIVRSSAYSQPAAGGCAPARPDDRGLATVLSANLLGLPFGPPPGATSVPAEWTMVVAARAGADIRTVKAVLVDGRKIDAAVDPDGWAFVAADGRVYFLEGYDAQGRLVVEVPVA
jgi:hypothetical protein